MPIVNTRADLDALNGQPDYAEALRNLLGSTVIWTNNGTNAAPQWVQTVALDQIEAMGFLSVDELIAECEAVGIAPPSYSPPAPPRALTVDEFAAAKLDAKRRVSARADEISESVTGIAPLSEKLSWLSKETAAIAYQADSATPSQLAMLGAEAAVTGETVADLCVKILANSEQYRAATGAIAGLRRTTMAAIDALTDHATFDADLEAIFVTAEATAATLLNSILNPE